VKKNELSDVVVAQTGCIGMCRLEPIVEVYKPGEDKVTYVKVTPAKAMRIVNEHVMKGKVVDEYTIGAEDK
ncbi:MAG: (2Fe-2S) ferredoxin protein, partial [Clostridia bacterium]|nr:(2Fe-2S) ferredoxin protein [Clostridia bacterium]